MSPVRRRSLLPALLALAAALACERAPRTVVAAPADPSRREPVAGATAPAPAPAAPAAPLAPPSPPSAGSAGPSSTAALVAQVDAMRAELDRREKPVEILVALGNLYFENGRYADAVGWYGQAIDVAEPGWKAYLALPASARAHAAAAAPGACPIAVGSHASAAKPGFAALSAAAEARARRRDPAGAAVCWRAALAPSLIARIQRGNARLLAGDVRGAIADHETALARVPDDPDALWFLGLALAESAGGDRAKLERAGALWTRLERVSPGGPHAEELRAARAELARRLAAAGAPAR
jgi:tetratricopeptide (TPR) repeat protein